MIASYCYLKLFGNFILSCSLWLSYAILDYLGLSWAISGYFWLSLSSIRVQVEASSCYLKLFGSFIILFHWSYSRGAHTPENLKYFGRLKNLGGITSLFRSYGLIENYNSYRMRDLCDGEVPNSLPLPLLERVDVEVDRAVECGQQVTDAGHIGQPGWPVH